jgi:hypothetical protein
MKIQRFGDFYKQESILEDFLLSLNETSDEISYDHSPQDSNLKDTGKEQSDSLYKSVQKKVILDLKLDSKLILTFGTGIGALYPVVLEMMQNMSISVDVSKQSVVLLTIAAITITYLEEKKFKTPEEEDILTKDSKSMLEELRMQGIGDGIVKKVIKALNGIKNIFSVIGKHLGAAVGGVIDMFAYTAILIPVMNAILAVIGIHEMSVDDVISNFFSLSIGVATRIAKHGLVEILDRLRNFVSPSSKREILHDL